VGDELQVPHRRVQVKAAPNIEPDGQLSEAEEAELYRHYGLDYYTMTLDNSAPAGQTRVGPTAKTTKPERTNQAGATATHIAAPASTSAGGRTDTGISAQPTTPPLSRGTPTWAERLTPASSSPSRTGVMLAMRCRPPPASRLNLTRANLRRRGRCRGSGPGPAGRADRSGTEQAW
jgi:hypothetical protein